MEGKKVKNSREGVGITIEAPSVTAANAAHCKYWQETDRIMADSTKHDKALNDGERRKAQRFIAEAGKIHKTQ